MLLRNSVLGHLIYTFDRIDDALIQQELSRALIGESTAWRDLFLVHAISRSKPSTYGKHLEDEVLIIPHNRGLYRGAADLINLGVAYFLENCTSSVRYLLVTASDTWLVDPRFIESVLREMERSDQVLAACSWMSCAPSRPRGLSTDFFVVDLHWDGCREVFPLDLDALKARFVEILWLDWTTPTLEMTFQYQYFRFFGQRFRNNDPQLFADKKLRRLIEREPVHTATGQRGFDWPEIGLYTWHDPKPKQELLERFSLDLGQ